MFWVMMSAMIYMEAVEILNERNCLDKYFLYKKKVDFFFNEMKRFLENHAG